MKGLSDEEMCILGLLEVGTVELSGSTISQLGLPRRLLEMGLVVRDAAGNPRLTRDGRSALFRSRCVDALRRADKNQPLDAHVGVEQWLYNARFLSVALTDSGTPQMVTRRGKEWLASLDQEDAPAGQPGLKKRMLPPKLARWLERK